LTIYKATDSTPAGERIGSAIKAIAVAATIAWPFCLRLPFYFTTKRNGKMADDMPTDSKMMQSLPMWVQFFIVIGQKFGIAVVFLGATFYWIVLPIVDTYREYVQTTAAATVQMTKTMAELRESVAAVRECETRQIKFFEESQANQKQGLDDHRRIMARLSKESGGG
jgi:hypothetical protein